MQYRFAREANARKGIVMKEEQTFATDITSVNLNILTDYRNNNFINIYTKINYQGFNNPNYMQYSVTA